MRTGSRSSWPASACTAGGKVAEKNRFCRRAGSSARMRASSSAKPRSSRRSASSSTSVATASQAERVVIDQVEQAPRRGHHDVGAAAQVQHLRVDRHAAEHDRRLQPPRQRGQQGAHRLADLRRQLARGHQHQRAGAPRRLRAARRRSCCSSGSAKAAVLPEPVCAVPSTSRPRKTSGMAADWMGVGWCRPSAAAARARAGESPSSTKGMGQFKLPR